jgi:hypothetical protein
MLVHSGMPAFEYLTVVKSAPGPLNECPVTNTLPLLSTAMALAMLLPKAGPW